MGKKTDVLFRLSLFFILMSLWSADESSNWVCFEAKILAKETPMVVPHTRANDKVGSSFYYDLIKKI